MMKFTIITPVLNDVRHIRYAIESVLDQKGDFDLEYIVVDGGSTDGTRDVLSRYADRITWISEPDGGQAQAINKGFSLASGDVLGWINADDCYLAGALGKVCAVFRTDPDVKWIIGKCLIIDERGHETRTLINRYKSRRLLRYSYKHLLCENFVAQPAVFFRRAFLQEVGSLDESLHYAMDYDLWLRMGASSDPRILNDYLAGFRWHARSKTARRIHSSLREAKTVVRRYACGRPLTLARAWLYRARIRIAYALLDTIRR